MLFNRLRQPEFERFRKKKCLKLLLEKGMIDVRYPFAPLILPEIPDWTEDPYSDETWCLYYHSLGWLIIYDYGIDCADNIEFREFCAIRLRFLFFSYLKYLYKTPKIDTPKMMWFDHATAWRSSAIAYLVERRFKENMSYDESNLVIAAVKLHVCYLKGYIDSKKWETNNHGLFHAEALWDIAQVFKRELFSIELKKLALSTMRSVFSGMIDTDEGVCREHSLYYHLFDAWLLSESGKYMSKFGIEIVPRYEHLLVKMVEFYLRCSPGYRQLPAIGDTSFGRDSFNSMLSDILKIVEPSAVSKYLIDGVNELDKPEHLKDFPSTGFYIFHDQKVGGPNDANVAILLDKPYSGAHAHTDGGSFTIDIAGTPLIIDSGGPYGYGKKLRYNYFKEAIGHNVVLFDRKSKPYLTKVTSKSQSFAGSAVRIVSSGLPNIRWQRNFIDLCGGIYLVVDFFESDRVRQYDSLMHFPPETFLEGTGTSDYTVKTQNVKVNICLYSSVSAKTLWSNGGKEKFPIGLVTRNLRDAIPSPVLSTGFSAKSGWLVTTISCDPTIKVQVKITSCGQLMNIDIHLAAESKCVELNIKNSHISPNITFINTEIGR